MKLNELIVRNRSCRRFAQTPRPGRALLVELVAAARLCASGGNQQRLRYWLAATPQECAAIFPHTRWAGLLQGWRPAPHEAPTAYILLLAVTGGATPQADAGIAMQTMLLAAVERGWGGCMLGALDRPALAAALALPAASEILYAVALGKPAEQVVLEEAQDGNTAYYRTPDEIHHVPKLPLANLIIN